MKPRRDTPGIKFIYRNIKKIDLMLGFLAFTSLFLILWEWNRRHNSLFGLSDEGYLYTQLSASKEYNPNKSLFSEILSMPYTWLGESIVKYRAFGLAVVVALAIYTFVSVWKASRINDTQSTSTFVAIACSIPVLLIPSSFRYLLMSPGYQWLIVVTSVVAFVILLKLSSSNLVTLKQLAFMCVPLFLVLQISLYTRLTYFLLLYLIMSFSLCFLKGSRRSIFLVFLLGALLFLVTTQGNLIEKWKDIISNANVIDPDGYSILNEVIDVGVSLLLVAAAVTAGKILFNSKMNSSQKNFLLPGTVLAAILILVFWTLVSRDRLAPVIFLIAILIGRFLPSIELIRRQKFKFAYLLLLSALPIASQFGSNTPALANANLALISITFLIPTFMRITDDKEKNIKPELICLLSLIVMMQIFSTQRSFETSLNQSSVVTVMGEEFTTSNAISQNLSLFQSDFNRAQVPQDEKILDLSLFHPGGGLYLSREVLPLGTADAVFGETFNKQVEILLEKFPAHFQGNYGLVLVSFPPIKDPISLNECLSLKDWLQFQLQESPLVDLKVLEVEYKVLSVMNSNVEQKNLFPNKLLVLSKCG